MRSTSGPDAFQEKPLIDSYGCHNQSSMERTLAPSRRPGICRAYSELVSHTMTITLHRAVVWAVVWATAALVFLQVNAESHTISFANDFLQTGSCGDVGENCTVVEATLRNGNSVAYITLSPPYAFSTRTGFGWYNGCEGSGADCTSEDRPEVYRGSSNTGSQVECSADNMDLAVVFCD
ncbi:hypothetical protein AcV7_000317 [Taiwanofungus camphoratus]|nr:hypothetical protein AcV7_000317 [Antrodia cinnamomea]